MRLLPRDWWQSRTFSNIVNNVLLPMLCLSDSGLYFCLSLYFAFLASLKFFVEVFGWLGNNAVCLYTMMLVIVLVYIFL